MATDQLINKTQGDAIISGLTAIKNAINDQPVPTQVEDVVADAFDVGVSYVPGDYCIYENKLYICDTAHHGAWDGNDFTLTTVGAVLESLYEALSDKLSVNMFHVFQTQLPSTVGNSITLNYPTGFDRTNSTIMSLSIQDSSENLRDQFYGTSVGATAQLASSNVLVTLRDSNFANRPFILVIMKRTLS